MAHGGVFSYVLNTRPAMAHGVIFGYILNTR